MGVEPITTIVGLAIVASIASNAIFEIQRDNDRIQELAERRQENEKRRKRQAKKALEEKRQEEEQQKQQEEEQQKKQEQKWRKEQSRWRSSVNETRRSLKHTHRWTPLRESESYFRDWTLETRPWFDWDIPSNPSCACGFCPPLRTQERNIRYVECSCESCKPNFHYLARPVNNFCNCDHTQSVHDSNTKLVSLQAGINYNTNARQNSKTTESNLKKSNSSPSYERKITQKKTSMPSASGSGSQPPQQNGNGKKDDEQIDKDYRRLNEFIKLLKNILERYKCSRELREKFLGFFKSFDKHIGNFLRLLDDLKKQKINEEDLLSIVIQLFQTNAFSKDVNYGNFLSLMEFVAIFITTEATLIMAKEDEEGEIPFNLHRSKSIKKVIERPKILDSIINLFNEIRKDIIKDNTEHPLDPDFSGIFTKVCHYFKHRKVRGKVMTVKEYFEWIRKLLPLVKSLKPEYTELMNATHSRSEIIFEMYVTEFKGRLRIVVRIYGKDKVVKICTVFVREKEEKNTKNGDTRVVKKDNTKK